MKFLVQTINKQLVHDFTFELTRCEEYHKWKNTPFTIRRYEGFEFDNIKNPDNYVPVGSVEFVSAYLNRFYPDANKSLKPLNVPENLFPFAGRTIANIAKPDDILFFKDEDFLFVKNLNVIKHPENGFIHLTPDKYSFLLGKQVSSCIDFASEWRVFVMNGLVLDCRCYSGDFFTYPDRDIITTMTYAYKDAPKVYTIDVGVTTDGETVVIECHRFFSCGLYGFSMQNLYPAMLSQTWFEMKNMK